MIAERQCRTRLLVLVLATVGTLGACLGGSPDGGTVGNQFAASLDRLTTERCVCVTDDKRDRCLAMSAPWGAVDYGCLADFVDAHASELGDWVECTAGRFDVQASCFADANSPCDPDALEACHEMSSTPCDVDIELEAEREAEIEAELGTCSLIENT